MDTLSGVRNRTLDLFTYGSIEKVELQERLTKIDSDIEAKQVELEQISYATTQQDQLDKIIRENFDSMRSFTNLSGMENAQLRKIIDRIEVDKDGNKTLYLRSVTDLNIKPF